MTSNQQIVEALSTLVKSSEISNKTNLAILATIERLANQQPNTQDTGELLRQFTEAMGTAKERDLVPVVSPVSHETSETRTVKVSKTSGEIVQEYLEANPDIEDTYTLRELEGIIGISYSTIRRVLKKMGRM